MANNKSPPTIIELFDDLVRAGRLPHQACREIELCLRDRTLTLLDKNSSPKNKGEIVQLVIDVMRGYTARDWLSEDPYLLPYLKRVFIVQSHVREVPARAARQASEITIRNAIRSVYDEAELGGTKPPNIEELPPLALAKLKEMGLVTTLARVVKIGARREFAERRRPVVKPI